MKDNQKINLPAVVEDDVSFFHQAAMAMRQGLASASRRVEGRAEALRRQVASTKAIIAARPIVSDYSRKISGGAFPVRVNGQWVDVASADFLGWLFQAGHIEEYSDAGEIRNMGYVYTEQEFLEWLHQLEGLLASYFQATGSAPEWALAGDAWISDIREIQEAGDLPAEEYTPAQLAALYEYYDMMDFTHSNERAL